MADPSPFPFSDLHFNGALTSLVPEVSVPNASGHLMLMRFLRHLLTKVCSLWVFDLVVLHVSEPYSRTELTVVLKILILLWGERVEVFQMGRRVLKACLAMFIRLLMSSSVPPSLLTSFLQSFDNCRLCRDIFYHLYL